MNPKLKKILTNVRVIIALFAVIAAIFAINPNPYANGVAIRSVELDSAASLAGIESPDPTSTPTSRERIIQMNNIYMNDISDYYEFIENIGLNQTIFVKTNKDLYRLTTLPEINIITLNEQELKTVQEIVQEEVKIDNTINITETLVNKTILVNKTVEEVIGIADIGLSVYNAPKSNIKKGIDIEGGTRVLLSPDKKLDDSDVETLIDDMENRLNVYGLSDLVIREANDLSDNQYILVEIPGANEQDVKELLSQQGKLEGSIGDHVIFNSSKDIFVCKSADCSGIDPQKGCYQIEGSRWQCVFAFQLSLKPEIAQRQAEATANLPTVVKNKESYLSEPLTLRIDGKIDREINIGESLRGQLITEVTVSGPGEGSTEQEAFYNTLENMNKLQTILKTGKLPVNLIVTKTDNISPLLGEEFIRSAMIMGIVALLSIGIFIFLRYRKLSIALPMIATSIIEVIILLGIAAIFREYMTIDLAAIAGILIAVGSGVDHLIIISDETLSGEMELSSWKGRIKNAFYIIIATFFTTVLAMVPLIWAGVGLLKGFAIMTILGVSIGVFIARPAYAAVIEILLK